MELDHLFIFVNDPGPVSDSLRQFGLEEGTPNIHQGQGTACRRFFFQNAYLELVWVINQQEIKSLAVAKTRLWERSQHRLTNYCPFGLCFRAEKKPENSIAILFEDSWRYHSDYLPEGQFVNIASNHNFPGEPMLFEMPFFGIAPIDYPMEKQQPLTNERGFRCITKVDLTLPTSVEGVSPAMEKVIRSSCVAVSPGKDYSVVLEFDDAKTGNIQNFNDLIPLTIKW